MVKYEKSKGYWNFENKNLGLSLTSCNAQMNPIKLPSKLVNVQEQFVFRNQFSIHLTLNFGYLKLATLKISLAAHNA